MNKAFSEMVGSINSFGLFKNVLQSNRMWNTFGIQQIRNVSTFKKKPRWVPKAPSKLYVVTTRRRLPPNEHKESLRIYNHHRFYMRHIYEHCKNENFKLSATSQFSTDLLLKEEELHKSLMEYNEMENKRMAELREKKIELQHDALLEEILEFKMQEIENQSITRQEKLKELEDVKKLVQTFISEENLEKAIEDAIDSPSDYNFSIDIEGNVYKGREVMPHLMEHPTYSLPIKDSGKTSDFL